MNPTVNIKVNGSKCMIRLNSDSMELINSDTIVFDKHNFTMRTPTIYDNKTYKIMKTGRKGSFCLFNLEKEPSEIVGDYTIEKEGDDFILIKQN